MRSRSAAGGFPEMKSDSYLYRGCINAERINGIVCDAEMKMGFGRLKEHFWKLRG